MNADLVTIPADIGPAMKALPNDRWRRFVLAMFELGDLGYYKAAIEAGVTGTPGAVKVTAYRMAHDPRVQEAFHEEASRRLGAGKIVATHNLLKIASNPMHKDQLRAITAILDRTGLHATTEHKVQVNNKSETDEAMIARIKELADKMGLDQTKLLGHNPPAIAPPKPEEARKAEAVVEGEFTEVEPEVKLEDLI